MWARSGIRPRPASFAWAAEAAASAAIATKSTRATRTKPAAVSTSVTIAEPTTTAATTWWCGRGRPIKLNLRRHRLSAILRKIEADALAFAERLDPSLCQSRDVNEYVGAATIG
jgi:hypothetical protein